MKNKLYPILTILLLFLIILMGSSEKTVSPISSGLSLTPKINQEKLAKNPAAVFLIINYLILIIIGLILGTSLLIKKIKKEPLFIFSGTNQQLLLSPDKTNQLTFLIILSFFIIKLSQYFFSFAFEQLISLLNLNLFLELLIIGVIIRYLPLSFLDFKLSKSRLIATIKIYLACLPIFLCAAIINDLLTKKFQIDQSVNPAVSLMLTLHNKNLIIFLFLQTIITAPIAEELLFRGFFFKYLRGRYSFIGAATIVSLFFSLLHQVANNILPLFIIGLALCYVYEKTQRIIYPILFHFFFNFSNVIMLLILKDMIK